MISQQQSISTLPTGFDPSGFQQISPEIACSYTNQKLAKLEPLAQQFFNIAKAISSPMVSQADRMAAHEAAENLATQYEPVMIWRAVMKFCHDQEIQSYASKWLHFHLRKRWESLPHLLIFKSVAIDIFESTDDLARHTINMIARICAELYARFFSESDKQLVDHLHPFFAKVENTQDVNRVHFGLSVLLEFVTLMSGHMSESDVEESSNNNILPRSSSETIVLKFRDLEAYGICDKVLRIMVDVGEKKVPSSLDLCVQSMEVFIQVLNFDWTGGLGTTEEELQTLLVPQRWKKSFDFIKKKAMPFVLQLLQYAFFEEFHKADTGGKMSKTCKILEFLTVLASWEGIFGSPTQVDTEAVFAFLSIIFHMLDIWSADTMPCFLHEEEFLESFSKFLSRFALNCSLGNALPVLPNEIHKIWECVLKFISILYRDSNDPEMSRFHGANSGHSTLRHCGRKLFFFGNSPRHILSFFLHVTKSCEDVADKQINSLINNAAAEYIRNYLAYLTPSQGQDHKEWVEMLELDSLWHDELKSTSKHLAGLIKNDPAFAIQTYYNLLSEYASQPNLIVELKLTFLVHIFNRILEVNLSSSLEDTITQETTVFALSYMIALSFFIFQRQQQASTNAYDPTSGQFAFLRVSLLNFFAIMCSADRIQGKKPSIKDIEGMDPNQSKFQALYDRVSDYLSSTMGSHFAGRNRTNLSENMIKISMQIFEYWSNNDLLMRENVVFLKLFADSDWRNMEIFARTIMEHIDTFLNQNRFPFLNARNLMESGEDELRAHKHLRRQFHVLLGRAVFHGFKHANGLEEKLRNIQQIDKYFESNFSFQQFETLSQEAVFKYSLIGLCINLRGICESIDDPNVYSLFFNWFFPRQMEILTGLLFQWNSIPGNSDVVVALLRLLIEISKEKTSCGIIFESNSPNGILYFRSICDMISRYGEYHISGNNEFQYAPDVFEREVYKPRGVLIKLMSTLLEQSYLPFGVLYLTSEDRLISMERVIISIFSLIKSMKDMHKEGKFLSVFPKIASHYMICIEILCRNHSAILSTLSSIDFQDFLEDIADAIAGGGGNAKIAASALDYLLCEIVKDMWLVDRHRIGYHEDETSDQLNKCRCSKCCMDRFGSLFQQDNIVISLQSISQLLLDSLVFEVVRRDILISLIRPILPIALLFPQVIQPEMLRVSAVFSRRLQTTNELENLIVAFFQFFERFRNVDKVKMYHLTARDTDSQEWIQWVDMFRLQYFNLKEALSASQVAE